MIFKTVLGKIIELLNNNSENEFTVTHGVGETVGADKVTKPNITIFYERGVFPKAGAALAGPYQHEATFRIEHRIVMPAKSNLFVIHDPGATDAELAAALLAAPRQTADASAALDELFSRVFNILMDAEYYDLNLPIGTVVNRKISNFDKDRPMQAGGLLVLTGWALFTCVMEEAVGGLEGQPGGSVDINLDVGDKLEHTTGHVSDI